MNIEIALILLISATIVSATIINFDVYDKYRNKPMTIWESFPGQFPYYVHVVPQKLTPADEDDANVGGAIISRLWVITIASACVGAAQIKMVFGVLNLAEPPKLTLTSKHWVTYPGHIMRNGHRQNYDICLVHLPQELSYNTFIKPINLDSNIRNSYYNYEFVSCSYEKTKSGTTELHWTFIMGIADMYCQKIFPTGYTGVSLCTRLYPMRKQPKDHCQWDSGSPLTMVGDDGTATLVGIASARRTQKCDARTPKEYLQIGSFHDWITRTMSIYPPPGKSMYKQPMKTEYEFKIMNQSYNSLLAMENEIPTKETNTSTITTNLPTEEWDLTPTETDLPATHADLLELALNSPTVRSNMLAKLVRENTDLPTMETEVPIEEIDLQTMNTEEPSTMLDLATTETDLPTSDIDLPTTETDSAITETDLPTTETDSAVRETDSPLLETDLPTAETDFPPTENDLAITDTELPTTETDPAVGETDLTTKETDLPTAETDLPTAETDLPPTETDLAITDTVLPTTETDPAVGETDLTTKETDFPTTEPDLPTTETELLTTETDWPATKSDMPTKGSKKRVKKSKFRVKDKTVEQTTMLPTTEKDLLIRQEDLPTTEQELPATISDEQATETEAPTTTTDAQTASDLPPYESNSARRASYKSNLGIPQFISAENAADEPFFAPDIDGLRPIVRESHHHPVKRESPARQYYRQKPGPKTNYGQLFMKPKSSNNFVGRNIPDKLKIENSPGNFSKRSVELSDDDTSPPKNIGEANNGKGVTEKKFETYTERSSYTLMIDGKPKKINLNVDVKLMMNEKGNRQFSMGPIGGN